MSLPLWSRSSVVEDFVCIDTVVVLGAFEANSMHVDDDGLGGVEDVLVDDGAVLCKPGVLGG